MLAKADLVVTVRDEDGTLVGVARVITDFAYCTYLSDLAVDMAHQGQRISRELIRVTHEHAGLDSRLILLAAPVAASHYPYLAGSQGIGMGKHESCWMTRVRESF